MTKTSAKGSIPAIIRNDTRVYEGDLVAYFRVLWNNAQNLHHPYHNFRHICHVLWLCHEACLYYRDVLTPRQMRNLLIAAIFHDFNHTGLPGPDSYNIEAALKALAVHLYPEDFAHHEEIRQLIRATQYPYVIESQDLVDVLAKIIRDADMGQAFSVAWIQQVIFGLAAEKAQTPTELVKAQGFFFGNLRFHTQWGQQMFPAEVVQAKIDEAMELLQIVSPESMPLPR